MADIPSGREFSVGGSPHTDSNLKESRKKKFSSEDKNLPLGKKEGEEEQMAQGQWWHSQSRKPLWFACCWILNVACHIVGSLQQQHRVTTFNNRIKSRRKKIKQVACIPSNLKREMRCTELLIFHNRFLILKSTQEKAVPI